MTPKQTSDNAVALFSLWSPSELSRIRFEPSMMRVVTIEADERRRMNNENTRRGGSAAHRRGPSRSKLQQQVAELAAQRAAISEVLRAITVATDIAGQANVGVQDERSTGQCNTACSLSAGVRKPKVFRGR